MELNRFIKSLSLQPSFCCGVETVGLMALSTGMGLFGTAMTNESNQNINANNLKFSREEAEKQRQWQSDEWTRQYNIQRDEWYNQLKSYSDTQWQQFLRQAEYNSPKNQVSRLAQAGLNPSAILGGQGSSGLISAASGNIASVGSPSPPSGGTVSGASASTPSQIPMQSPASVFQSMGSVLRDLAAASKDNKLTEPMVALLGSQFINQELRNEWQKFENEVLSKTKDYKVKQAFADLKNSFADFVVKSAMYENYSADTLLKDAERALTVAKERCSNEEYEVLAFNVAHQFETWRADMKLKGSQTASNNASAFYFNALGVTENDLRQYRVDNAKLINEYQEYVNRMSKNDADISDWTKNDRFAAITNELVETAARQGIITQQLQQSLEKAMRDNDWYLVNHVLGPLLGIGTAATIVSGAVPASRPKIGFTR